ncbi:MAG: winged helix-turn-helix transcriptional regulator [Burkholderiaceae bacterium]
MYIRTFVKLCEKAWTLTALALIGRGTPIRVAVLATAAGTTRSSMRPSIQHLFELGLLVHNPGHGHPLRPEAKLTSEGEYWAEFALKLEETMRSDDERRLIRLNWTLPTLRVAETPVRFTVLRNTLAPVRDSALSMALRRLESSGWLERQVDSELRPPQVAYLTINRGREIADLLRDTVTLN